MGEEEEEGGEERRGEEKGRARKSSSLRVCGFGFFYELRSWLPLITLGLCTNKRGGEPE